MPTVASVSPANAAVGVAVDQPVTVELTRSDSHNLVKVETTQADFAAGTLVSVSAVSDGSLQLSSALVDTFEADTIGSMATGWTQFGGANITVQSVSSNKVLQRTGTATQDDRARWDTAGTFTDIEFYGDFQVPTTKGDPTVMWRITGTAASPTGYQAVFDNVNNVISVYKTIAGVATKIVTDVTKAFTQGVWWHFRVQQVGTAMKIRVWTGATEPSTWDVNTTNGDVVGAGYVVLKQYVNANVYWDNIVIVGGMASYPSSGSRISPAHSLATVGKFGTGIVEFDATTPTNTTLTLSIATSATGPWTTVANGDRIALWNEGDDLAAANIFTKAELATTDTGQTPVLSEVRLRFLPIDSSLVEIDIDGVVHTIANGCLAIAGKTAKDVSGTITDPCYEDMTFVTVGSWQDYTPKTVNVLVKYAGTTISTTTFTTVDGDDAGTRATASTIQGICGGMYGGFMATASSALDGVTGMYGGYFITSLEYWYIRGEAGFLVAPPPFSSVDGRFYVAHRVIFDMAASGVVGQPSVTDVPGSGVVQAYQRADVPAAGVVLAYQQSDLAGSGVVAVPLNPADVAASGIVGIVQRADVPASGLVYETNARTGIELRVISVQEAALLDAMGLLRR